MLQVINDPILQVSYSVTRESTKQCFIFKSLTTPCVTSAVEYLLFSFYLPYVLFSLSNKCKVTTFQSLTSCYLFRFHYPHKETQFFSLCNSVRASMFESNVREGNETLYGFPFVKDTTTISGIGNVSVPNFIFVSFIRNKKNQLIDSKAIGIEMIRVGLCELTLYIFIIPL